LCRSKKKPRLSGLLLFEMAEALSAIQLTDGATHARHDIYRYGHPPEGKKARLVNLHTVASMGCKSGLLHDTRVIIKDAE